MALAKEDKVPRIDRVMLVDTKTIDLDRTLINLFMLIKHRGFYPAARSGIVDRTPAGLADWLCEDPHVQGFEQHKDVVTAWLKADFLDLVNRNSDKEALAAPRPLHLNAYKLRNARNCKDYGSAAQLFNLLADEESRLPEHLRERLLKGCDPNTDRFQGDTDLETLVVLRLADREGKDQQGKERVPRYRPLCTGQGRLLRNDVRRLLRYESVIPRPVWVEYFKTLCGLHLALFVRRLATQISTWIQDREVSSVCLSCPVNPMSDDPMRGCPFAGEYVVDMGDRADTHMARLSRISAEDHFAAIDRFVGDMVALSKLVQYVDGVGQTNGSSFDLVSAALKVYREDDPELRGYCRAKLNTIVGAPPEGRFANIRDAFKDDPFRGYVECILLDRFGSYRADFRQLYRAVLSSNRDTGMLVSGRSPRSPNRFHLGTKLLETLVQIAVLKPDGTDAAGQSKFRSEPILVSELLDWLRRRYGIGIGASQLAGPERLSPGDLKALRENEEDFKDRLREIGFYTDLSDAYNAQHVSPRYRVGG
jgi:hypothetical protein